MRLVGQKQVCGAVKAIGGGRVVVCFRSRPTFCLGFFVWGQRISNQDKGEVSLYKNWEESKKMLRGLSHDETNDWDTQ